MSKILIAINPEHVAKILSGEKKYEYRTKTAKRRPDTPLIYQTAPMKKVVAQAQVIEVLELPSEELWKQTQKESGIRKEFFDSYFQGRPIAYAYHLGEVSPLETPEGTKLLWH